MNAQSIPLPESYDPFLVGLSILVAVLASYTALDLAGRVTATEGRARLGWLVGGAFAMGTGIWSMHFIGMLAFSLPIPMYYDTSTVAVSLIAAILASGIALSVVSQHALSRAPFIIGGLLLGLGISLMHYTGMAAMRLEAGIRYNLVLVALSILIAMVASFYALWVAFHLRAEASASATKKKLGGAIIMGACIPAMHYVGMAAASFWVPGEAVTVSPYMISASALGGFAVAVTTLLVLGVTLVTSMLDRRFAVQAVELQKVNEQLKAEIAERVRVTQELEQREKFLCLLQEHLNEIAYIEGPDGKVVFISSAYQRITGRDPHKLHDDPMEWINAVHPEDQARVAEAWQARAWQGNFREEFRAFTQDGGLKWFQDHCVPVLDESGQRQYLVGIVEDITELKRREAALQQSQAQLRSVTDAIPGVVYQTVTDKTGAMNFSFISGGARELLGYSAEQLQHNFDLAWNQLLPEDAPGLMDAIVTSRNSGKPITHEFRVRRNGGPIQWIRVNKIPEPPKQDGSIVENGIMTDVTELKRAEEALREAMALTQKANERMRRDLEAAARVQQGLLPERAPSVDSARFAWVYRPSAELGGDSLNVFQLDDGHIGMYVLDVSGHGVPASLLSVTLSRVLTPRGGPACLFSTFNEREGVSMVASPAEVADRLNRMFPMGAEVRQYFTLIYGILDTKLRQFRFVCAGHPAPIHFAKIGRSAVCEARNLPVGMFEDERYEECAIALEAGDRVYLYSDGVLEAMNRQREIFDEPRLIETIEAGHSQSLKESVDSIVQAVFTWSGNEQVHDDLSILAVEFK